MKIPVNLGLRLVLLIVATAAMTCNGLAASGEEARPLLEKWMKTAANVRTIQADIEQVRLLSTVKTPLRRPGKLWMETSGQLRWQIGEPPTMIVVRDKTGSLRVLDAKTKKAQVWSKEALLKEEAEGRGQGFAMMDAMRTPKLEDFEKRFEIKGATQDEKNASIWRFDLALKDRKAGAFVRQIQLTTNVDDGTLLSLLLVMRDKSSLGTYIRTQRLNDPIPASTFQVNTDGYAIEEMK